MALTTMYPGKINSPETTVDSPGIDDDDTEIPVVDVGVFPAAPNLATLWVVGEEDEAETVRYTVVGASSLTVVREIQGTAKAWAEGTKIARLFTELDYDTLCDNITDTYTLAGSHHTQHESGGGDAIKLDDLSAPDDNTDLDASTSKHGLLSKLPNDATKYLNGVGTWTDAPHRASMARQAIINGNFDVWQRGTSFTAATTPANSDDTYLPDRWILLSDGNDIVDVSRESTVIPSTGSLYSLKAEVETANKKFGFLTILENADAKKLAGKTVSLSFQARTTTSKVIENIRAAVISWSSTADAVTSDVISAWGNEGTNPTLAANWTYENTPANIAITTNFATYKVEGIAIDTANTANIGVFIWVDDTDAAVDDLLYLSQVQLCAGDIALPFEPKTYAEELQSCMRYYQAYLGAISDGCGFAFCNSTSSCRGVIYAPVEMRAEPTLSTSGTASDYRIFVNGGIVNATAVPAIGATSTERFFYLTMATGTVPINAAGTFGGNNANAVLNFSAEL